MIDPSPHVISKTPTSLPHQEKRKKPGRPLKSLPTSGSLYPPVSHLLPHIVQLCAGSTYLINRGPSITGGSNLWTGHSALMGKKRRPWQATDMVLGYFGRTKKEARRHYETFVGDGVAQGRRPELVGGGLIRSLGGWSQVLALRRKGTRVACDDRVLGSGDFVETLLQDAESRERETLRLRRRVKDLDVLAREVCEKEGLSEGELRSGSRVRKVTKARRIFCRLAVKEMGYAGAEVARLLGVTTSAVNRTSRLES